MVQSISRNESDAPIEGGRDGTFQEMLDAAGLTTDYKQADGQVAYKEVVGALQEAERYKKEQTGKVAPESYSFDLPKDFQKPEGFSGEWKPDAKVTAQITAIAKAKGWDQETVSELTQWYAQHTMGQAQEKTSAVAAEREKLGPKADERMADGYKALTGLLDEKRAAALIQGGTAESWQALEDLIALAKRGGGMANARGNGAAKEDYSGLVGRPDGYHELWRRANAPR